MTAKLMPRAFAMTALAASISFVALASKQVDPFADITVSRSYEAPGFGKLDLAGVCSANPDSIECWNADGASDPGLAEKIKAYYIVQSSQELRFKIGRKNRLVAFMRPGNQFGGFGLSNAWNADNQNAMQAGQLQGNNGSQNDRYLQWYSIDTDPGKTTTSMGFDLTSQVGSATLPLREGASAQMGKLTVTLVSIKPVGPNDYPRMGPTRGGKRWAISLSMSGPMGKKAPSISATVLDRKGAPVRWTDKNGNPLPDSAGNAAYRSGTPSNSVVNVYSEVLRGYGTPEIVLAVPVDPSKASGLALTAQASRRLTITDIPLDPK